MNGHFHEMKKTVFTTATQVRKLAKSLHMDSHAVALEFRMWKAGRPTGNNLSTFLDALSCLPISTAECERGFSDMNLARTNIGNALTIIRVASLLFVKINGSPLKTWKGIFAHGYNLDIELGLATLEEAE